MTPSEHRAAAEAGLAALASTTLVGPTDAGLVILQARAHLASALGTGTHYEAADELLATLPSYPDAYTESSVARRAILHALLADR